MKSEILYASIVSVLTAVANAQNANITWNTPLTISGASDVSTSGTVVGTWAPGDDTYNPDSSPVNGVTFNAFGSGPFASFLSTSGANNHYDFYNSPGTADSNYNNLLKAAVYNDGSFAGGASMSLTWGGMTSGDTYLLEFWVNDARNGGSVDRSETLTGGANTSGALTYGFAGGGIGNYIIGTFVADGTGTETLTMNASGGGGNGPSAQINLLQLRDITVVPEPSTLAILAAGVGTMFFGLRRKIRAA